MKILVADKISDEAIKMLKEKHEVVFSELDPKGLLNEIEKYDALVIRSRTKVTKEVIKKGKNLKVIGRAGVGVDNIDVPEATKRKIPVVNAPGGATVSVAELTFAHMLSLARNLSKSDKTMKNGEWEKKTLKGTELCDKTLGLIGSGRIGTEVGKMAIAFGMKVIVYDPYLSKETAEEQGFELADLDSLLKNSDFISIHTPLTDETKKMIDEKEFKKMKNTAFIVNCARGGIIDENALYNSLKEGKIRGAALDVYENEPPKNSPLLTLDNIVFTPHIGASTKEAQIRAGTITAEQVLKVLKNEKPDFCVNKEIV
ncbi:MAG: phosphoglycerate dehydrogenase [Euryarchaeota archaeon CG01_land_8_20_14_3_00_38_12]|nr:MAG: phosphoglycerate dehydrogenase [Euryarchaeota archaeon CG01_land_8_20_14_3_00_38_12]